ncbi:MAG: tetratricopeptide repeat protein [Spirochaetes bacterium]|nr:tetratricopeptide repeat protein [Spirochaetota bacterium]MBN2770455.1 tetratricopeptide repeat protein [Spirochaetota bacterium]
MSKVNVEQNKFEKIAFSVFGYISSHRKIFIASFSLIIVVVLAAIAFAVYYDKHQSEIVVQYEAILDEYSRLIEEEKKEEAVNYAVSEIVKLSDSAKWGYIKDNGYYLAAGILYHNKRYEEALEYYNKFVDNSGSSELIPLARIQIAVTLEWLERNDEAFEIYKNLEVDLADTKFIEQIIYDLGRHYERTGDVKKAKEYYSRLVSEYIGSFYEKQAKKRLMLMSYKPDAS